MERLARAMARRGHEVTGFTSHYSRDLLYTEMMDGVRVPVLFRFSKACDGEEGGAVGAGEVTGSKGAKGQGSRGADFEWTLVRGWMQEWKVE